MTNITLQDISSSCDKYSVHIPFANVCSHFGQQVILQRVAGRQGNILQPIRVTAFSIPQGVIRPVVLQDTISFDPTRSVHPAVSLLHVLILKVSLEG